jgi:translation initiation factor 1 (eIF-1/SUI1)
MPFTIGGDWVPSEPTSKEKKPSRPVKVRLEKRGKNKVTLVLNLQKEKSALKELATKL